MRLPSKLYYFARFIEHRVERVRSKFENFIILIEPTANIGLGYVVIDDGMQMELSILLRNQTGYFIIIFIV